MQLDTRARAARIMGEVDHTVIRGLVKIALCALVAWLVAMWAHSGAPMFDNLSNAGRTTLWIMVFAALMWITEAIPAYAVALLVMGMQILILGRPGGVFAEAGDTHAWQAFVQPWSSPLMWLFVGGFTLAIAASKTDLDQAIAMRVLKLFGTKPAAVLAGCMTVTFVFSMFMSNTATAAMMIAVVAPVARALPKGDPFIKALYLGIPVGANIGGMGTIIGSPPNAIAAGALEAAGHSISFLGWMQYGLPPALLLAVVGWYFLKKRYPCEQESIELKEVEKKELEEEARNPYSMLHRLMVGIIFVATVALWMTEKWHKMPSAVVSFIPIVGLTVTGVLTSADVRKLQWDVLLLLSGGLSLGVAVAKTGLAAWFASLLPVGLAVWILVIVVCYLAVAQSNLMSNTATASILMPICIGLASGDPTMMAVAVALCCSCAMMLPISTPPNAVAYASGYLETRDFIKTGVMYALLSPLIIYLWVAISGGALSL